jgi:hypothetical protein
MSRQLVPLPKAPEHNIPVSRHGLEWISFHREFNGAAKAGAIVKFGGRIFIDPPRFLDWMATGPRISPPVRRVKAPIGSARPRRASRSTAA